MEAAILKSFIPEMYFSFSILVQLLFNIKFINNLRYNYPLVDNEVVTQSIFILLCLFLLFFNLKIEGFFSNFFFLNDDGIRYLKLLFIFACLVLYPLIFFLFKIQKLNFFEFFIILMLSIFSMLLIISSYDFITFYIVIEMQSLCFYILSCFKKNSAFSVEAGLKYFISGSFISGFFLLGISIIYVCLGTLNLNLINFLLFVPLNENLNHELGFFLVIGFILVICVLLFKLSCAPFHFWSPDVYDGAPFASLLIFSVLPKISLFVFFIKFISCLNLYFNFFQDLLLFFGVFSILLGTVFALNQKKIKKLLIYSSIAQVGFLVAVLSLDTSLSQVYLYFFLILYVLTSLVIWSFFSVFHSFQFELTKFYLKRLNALYISDLSVLYKNNIFWGFSFLIIFFSIGGIPPLSGFLSKLFLLLELSFSGSINAAKFVVIITCISMYYYLRVLKVIFFESSKLKKSKNIFQFFFFSLSLNFLHILHFIGIYSLFIIFFYPYNLILVCQYIVFFSSFI